MKESVLDVLLYLFEHYVDDDVEVDSDQAFLERELLHAGFPQDEVATAFDWLEGLVVPYEVVPAVVGAGPRSAEGGAGDDCGLSDDSLGDSSDRESTATAAQGFDAASAHPAMRVYAKEEMARMDVECRGFLVFLQQAGVIDANTRERIIDRVMALDMDDIDLERLKWVTLMVLYNQPGNESSFWWMEDYVLDAVSGRLH